MGRVVGATVPLMGALIGAVVVAGAGMVAAGTGATWAWAATAVQRQAAKKRKGVFIAQKDKLDQ